MNHVHIDDLEEFIETAAILGDVDRLGEAVGACQDFLPALYLSKRREAVEKRLAGEIHDALLCEERADEYSMRFREMVAYDADRALVHFHPPLHF